MGLVHVGTFGVVDIFGLGADGDLNTEDFLTEGCFVRGKVRGRYVQKPDVGEL